MKQTRYIWYKGKHIPVTQEVYEAYYRPLWRERKRRAAHKNDLSYEAIMEIGSKFPAGLAIDSAEEFALAKIQSDELRCFPGTLTPDEFALITSIYFDGKTEREIAAIFGLSQKAINKRKRRILEKLKDLMSP